VEKGERSEDPRSRFRQLAAEMERIHEEWRDASARDDLRAETRLIEEETKVLAEIDELIREFRGRALPGGGNKGGQRPE
jgi:hypothetical protein